MDQRARECVVGVGRIQNGEAPLWLRAIGWRQCDEDLVAAFGNGIGHVPYLAIGDLVGVSVSRLHPWRRWGLSVRRSAKSADADNKGDQQGIWETAMHADSLCIRPAFSTWE